MQASVFARSPELKLFDSLMKSKEAEFVAVYGRRRIGKTYLIHQYFKDKGFYFELTGMYRASLSKQLANFATVYADTFKAGVQDEIPKSWQEAFTQLRKKLEKISHSKKIIVFLDELPWLASPRSGFMSALDLFWNRYLSRMPNVILIVCGSAASWMIKKIVNDRGGLHGRLTKQIPMKSFDIIEAEAYLKFRGVELTRKQFLELYMAIGGVAKYLSQVNKGLSTAQIVDQLCFNSQGYLYKEFHRLYRSLFDNYEIHVKIIRSLAKTKSGLTREELGKATNISSGGTLTKILDELTESGFIRHDVKYKLVDYYSLFYLKWIEPIVQKTLMTEEVDYWLKQHRKPAWYNWAGVAFENICLEHVELIKKVLGISGIAVKASTWQNKNAQIDLLLDRADQCINLVEIKFHDQEFVMTKEYAEKLERKKLSYINAAKTKKAVFITLITTYGAVENSAYHSIVTNQLKLEDMFN